MDDPTRWLDATALAELVDSGEATPLELVDAAITRIEALNPALNAVIHTRYEAARAEAARPLPAGTFRGVPFLVKDAVCHTAGDPYHLGTRFLRDAGHVAADDTELARRYRAAGLVIVGRTNTPEFATAATTEPLAHGATHNPWDLGRSPGGSSGGSGAAVAAGLVPMAHGNDMGGSIRVPSAYCGLFGLKPSRARSSLGPHYGEYWAGLTHEHVLTRSVRDSALALDATAGAAVGDPYTAPLPAGPFALEVGAPAGRLRIGVRTARPDTGADPHPEVALAVMTTAGLLEELGHDVEVDPLHELDGYDGLAGVGHLITAWLAFEIGRWEQRLGRTIDLDELEPQNAAMVERGRAMTASEYLAGLDALQAYARRVAAWTLRFDLLVLPTTATPAPPLGLWSPLAEGDDPVHDRLGAVVYTVPFDATGEPAASLPLHRTADGLPVGVQVVAPYGREDALLRVAAQLEQAAPWAHRHPA
jgi:amidase